LRVLVVWPGATWSTADVARGWANGLEQAGADVVRFRFDQRIEWLGQRLADEEADTPESPQMVRRMAAESLAGALYDYRPDVTVVVDGKDIPPEAWRALRRRGEKVVLIHTESPYEDRRIEAMWWCADVHLVNDPAGAVRLQAKGVDASYAPHCYDPAIHHPNGSSRDGGVVFVGSGFSGRAKFLAQVDWAKAGPLTLAGHWDRVSAGHVPKQLQRWVADLPEPLPNEDAAGLYRSHQLGLNLYRTDYVDHGQAAGWAVGPREVEMAACGLPFLRQSRPEGDQLFPMLPTFSSPEDLTDLAEWWLAHPEARKEAADAAQAAVADRTFNRHAATLLRRVA